MLSLFPLAKRIAIVSVAIGKPRRNGIRIFQTYRFGSFGWRIGKSAINFTLPTVLIFLAATKEGKEKKGGYYVFHVIRFFTYDESYFCTYSTFYLTFTIRFFTSYSPLETVEKDSMYYLFLSRELPSSWYFFRISTHLL